MVVSVGTVAAGGQLAAGRVWLGWLAAARFSGWSWPGLGWVRVSVSVRVRVRVRVRVGSSHSSLGTLGKTDRWYVKRPAIK